jgi:hypothetical protein
MLTMLYDYGRRVSGAPLRNSWSCYRKGMIAHSVLRVARPFQCQREQESTLVVLLFPIEVGLSFGVGLSLVFGEVLAHLP